MYLPTLLTASMIFTFLVSLAYLYMFVRSQERFIQYWGLCWVFYSCSLIFLIQYINTGSVTLLEIRTIFDMLNILFLLFGGYAFMHSKIPGYWIRFSLYLLIWNLIGIYYNFDLYGIYLPISVYQLTMTFVLCYLILKYWDIDDFEKGLSIIIFILWGVSKASLSIFETIYPDTASLYLLEIVLSNSLNFCILIIYVQKINKTAADTEKLFRVIAENATDIIFYYKLIPYPALAYISPSFEKITGYAPNEFYNNPRLYIEITDPSQHEQIKSIFDPLQSGTAVKRFKWYHKDDTIKWVEFNNSIIFEDGLPVAIEGAIRDITVMKMVEDELIQSKQARQLLLSYVSHELKTPVTSILGYINALKDETIGGDNERSAAIDTIFSKALTLENLIQDLFQLSKLETNQFSFKFMQLSPLELISSLIDKYSLDIKNADLRLITDIDAQSLSDISIIADPERIGQVFSNILFNALNYSSKNGKITIKSGLTAEKDFFFVSITDTGAGIPKEDLTNIFTRFYRVQSTARAPVPGGSGLGLTISKEIIEAHHGSINAKSRLEKGSTLIFTIPVYEEHGGTLCPEKK